MNLGRSAVGARPKNLGFGSERGTAAPRRRQGALEKRARGDPPVRCLRLSLCAPLRSPLPACTHAHKGAKRGEGPQGPAPGISRRVNTGGSLRPRSAQPPRPGRAAAKVGAQRSKRPRRSGASLPLTAAPGLQPGEQAPSLPGCPGLRQSCGALLTFCRVMNKLAPLKGKGALGARTGRRSYFCAGNCSAGQKLRGRKSPRYLGLNLVAAVATGREP